MGHPRPSTQESVVHKERPVPGISRQTGTSPPAPGTHATGHTPWHQHAITVLLALVPLSLVIHGSIKAVVPGLLFLAGLYLLVVRRDVRRDWARGWPVLAAAGLMLAFAIASTLGHGLKGSALDGPGHILLYMVVAVMFVRVVNLRIMWCGLSLSAVAFGILCIVQRFGLDAGRAYSLDGNTSTAIEFATLLWGLALMSLVQLLRARLQRREWWLHLAGLVLGAYGGLLTQSRGPLLAFVPVFLLLLLLHARHHGHWRRTLLWLGAIVLGAVIAMTTLQGAVIDRFLAIQDQVAEVQAGKVEGSVSERLEMWRTAVRGFAAHPWSGIGIEQFKDYTRAEVAAGRTSPVVAKYNNPHNMYLSAAVEGGIPGLLVLLVMLVVPVVFFFRRTGDPDDDIACAAWAGLAISLLYIFCAVTDSVFYRIMSQSFYYFPVLGLAVFVARREHQRPRTPRVQASAPIA